MRISRICLESSILAMTQFEKHSPVYLLCIDFVPQARLPKPREHVDRRENDPIYARKQILEMRKNIDFIPLRNFGAKATESVRFSDGNQTLPATIIRVSRVFFVVLRLTLIGHDRDGRQCQIDAYLNERERATTCHDRAT